MAKIKQRTDLFLALKGRIEKKLEYYNGLKPGEMSQPARVLGRKEGYEEVLQMIDEMLNIDVIA